MTKHRKASPNYQKWTDKPKALRQPAPTKKALLTQDIKKQYGHLTVTNLTVTKFI